MYLGTPETPLWTALEPDLVRWGCLESYWAFAWPGGQALARGILEHPSWVKGKTVLDIGGGGGVVALAALRAGASGVHLLDLDPWACIVAELNREANGHSAGRLTCSTEDLFESTRSADIITVGDLLYEAPFAAQLLVWLRAQATRGAVILVGDPGRGHIDPSAEQFEPLASYLAPTDLGLDGSVSKLTHIYRMTK